MLGLSRIDSPERADDSVLERWGSSEVRLATRDPQHSREAQCAYRLAYVDVVDHLAGQEVQPNRRFPINKQESYVLGLERSIVVGMDPIVIQDL